MTIAAVTCVRDEADVIEEWIAHHLALGIERIHIFDNMSADATRAKIEAVAHQVPVSRSSPGIRRPSHRRPPMARGSR